MKPQKEWFTGIDYYDNTKEKEIFVEECILTRPISLHAHVQVELWYVLSGSAIMEINGQTYSIGPDSCLCLYSHHLYQVHSIGSPLHVIVVKFFVGLFMHMMWEKHSAGKNAQLVYETHPLIDGSIDSRLASLFQSVLYESNHSQFGSENMILYQVLELHMLHCRYALQTTEKRDGDLVWNLIQNIIVSPSSEFSLKACANQLEYHPNYLNQKIKQMTGMSFFELCQFSKILNACALLHFEELDISYIVEQLGCTSTASFYRIFEKYTGMSPLEYRQKKILDSDHYFCGQEDFLKILQYVFLNFSSSISADSCASYLHMKAYTIDSILKSYGYTFFKLVEDVRYLYACVLLRATSMSVTQIALDCGFSSASNFFRMFSKRSQLSPSEFRNLIK